MPGERGLAAQRLRTLKAEQRAVHSRQALELKEQQRAEKLDVGRSHTTEWRTVSERHKQERLELDERQQGERAALSGAEAKA